jgi:hypothetical protein
MFACVQKTVGEYLLMFACVRKTVGEYLLMFACVRKTVTECLKSQVTKYTRSIAAKKKSKKVIFLLGKGKAIPVTGREGPQGCESSRLPHFL